MRAPISCMASSRALRVAGPYVTPAIGAPVWAGEPSPESTVTVVVAVGGKR